MDGNQQYVYDRNWRTVYKPAGSSQSQIVLTGLKEYNRADTNLQTDAGSVQVDGIPSAYKLSAMNGSTQYFSSAGLLLKKVDRFGNAIDFYYNANTVPQLARLAKIVDSWGNEIVFNYCANGSFAGGGSACANGDVQIDLPDGRSVGWRLAGDELRRIIDAQGKATVLNYTRACSSGYDVLSAVTSPSGASSTIEYQCMNVCTRTTYPQACTSDYKQWPVAFDKYDCPSNPSGQPCRQGSAADNLTTRFLIGGTSSTNALKNYTGYPFYSPYDAADPAADALMQSNDNSFEYVTTSQTVDGNGLPVIGGGISLRLSAPGDGDDPLRERCARQLSQGRQADLQLLRSDRQRATAGLPDVGDARLQPAAGQLPVSRDDGKLCVRGGRSAEQQLAAVHRPHGL